MPQYYLRIKREGESFLEVGVPRYSYDGAFLQAKLWIREQGANSVVLVREEDHTLVTAADL